MTDQLQSLPFRESLESKPVQPLVKESEDVVGPPEIPPEEIIFDREKDFLGEGLQVFI